MSNLCIHKKELIIFFQKKNSVNGQSKVIRHRTPKARKKFIFAFATLPDKKIAQFTFFSSFFLFFSSWAIRKEIFNHAKWVRWREGERECWLKGGKRKKNHLFTRSYQCDSIKHQQHETEENKKRNNYYGKGNKFAVYFIYLSLSCVQTDRSVASFFYKF